MSKGRYLTALIVALIVFIVCMVIGFIFLGNYFFSWLIILISYDIAAIIANLIWFDGAVIRAGAIGIGIAISIFSFIIRLLGSLGGWIILALIGMFLLSAFCAVLTFTFCWMAFLSAFLLPVNAIKFRTILY